MSSGVLKRVGVSGRVLVVTAVTPEARAVASGVGSASSESFGVGWDPIELGAGLDLLVSGVGKCNAAGSVARAMTMTDYGFVLNLGVCGSLPVSDNRTSVELGDIIAASESVFADEGVITPHGFDDLLSMGFAPDEGVDGPGSMRIEGDSRLLGELTAIAHHRGGIATVSICSGTDEHARSVVERSDCVAEAMEGAGVGLAVRRLGSQRSRFAELRVVSNTTGDRDKQRWDLAGTLAKLEGLAREILRDR